MFRNQKYRLYPTPEQEKALFEYTSVVRLIYNLALEQRRNFWKQYHSATGGYLNFASQGPQLTALRQEFEFIRKVPANCQHGALQDLDKAFRRFFSGDGYPQFRKKGVHESFEVKAAEAQTKSLNSKWSAFKVPKLGWIKFRDSRQRNGTVRSCRVFCKNGQWFVSIGVLNEYEAPASNLPPVGIDRGVTIALARSDGGVSHAPKGHDMLARKEQRILSRRKRGSSRYQTQRRRVASLKAKSARIRRDWQHKATTDIARQFGTVVIEDLKTSNMTRSGKHKRGLNREILNIGWHSLATMLAYKLEERGGTLIKTNPAYTSQTCSACGTIDKRSRENQARFVCTGCGHTENADINAAKNILRQGMPVVEGCGYTPVEARTNIIHDVNLRAA